MTALKGIETDHSPFDRSSGAGSNPVSALKGIETQRQTDLEAAGLSIQTQ